jgi:NifB/MoaA-like Fe-S oxidoreductase
MKEREMEKYPIVERKGTEEECYFRRIVWGNKCCVDNKEL